MSNQLKVGYACVNITPPLGVNIAGYFVERIADGVLDELEACAVAVADNDNVALLIAVDHCGLFKVFLDEWKEEISKVTGVSVDAIFIHSTHTHTGPELIKDHKNPLNRDYEITLKKLEERNGK